MTIQKHALKGGAGKKRKKEREGVITICIRQIRK